VIGLGAAGLNVIEQLAWIPGLKVHVFDVGPEYDARFPCPIDQGKRKDCPEHGPCSFCAPAQSGGIFNDGKFIRSASRVIGGQLWDHIGEEELQAELDAVAGIIVEHVPPGFEIPIARPSADDLAWINALADAAGMVYHYQVLMHLGSDLLPAVCTAILKTICGRSNNLVFHWNTKVVSLSRHGSGFLVNFQKDRGKTASDQTQGAVFDFAVVCVGRGGVRWLTEQPFWPALEKYPGQVDLGVRVETLRDVTAKLDGFYEPKLYCDTPAGEARNFCSNPGGEVCIEHHGHYALVNGHSKAKKKTKNQNFAVLIRPKDAPSTDPHLYSQEVAMRVNALAGGTQPRPLMQRLGDLRAGRPTASLNGNRVRPTLLTPCGDLTPGYPDGLLLQGVVPYLDALDRICPGVADDDTLVIGPEAKTYGGKVAVTKEMETTTIANLYLCGDGSGWTRGLGQAACSGRLAAKGIRRKLGL